MFSNLSLYYNLKKIKMSYLHMKDADIKIVVEELNKLLADYQLYYQKLRNFHWNIIGKNFFDLHVQFEEMYDDAKLKIDEIAERVITLNYHPLSNLSDYLEISEVKESNPLKKDTEMVSMLMEDQLTIIGQFRKVIKKANEAEDEGTIDLIGAYLREMEKSHWMLNSWLKKSSQKPNETFVK